MPKAKQLTGRVAKRPEVQRSAAIEMHLHKAALPPPYTAVVLAAGHGRRLGGRAKSTLEINGVSVLERLIDALLTGGAERVFVVVSPYRDKLEPLISGCGASALLHTHVEPSLVDSQRLAVQAHQARSPHSDLLLTVADLPLLTSQDVLRLLRAWQRRAASAQALLPVVDGVRGHPVLLSASAVRQVAEQAAELGVRDWLERHSPLVEHWQTSHAAYVFDMDTPADVEALDGRLKNLTVAWPMD